MVERRKLIVGLALGVAGALGLAMVAFNTTLLLASALLIGVFASVSQLIVGLAASLAILGVRFGGASGEVSLARHNHHVCSYCACGLETRIGPVI